MNAKDYARLRERVAAVLYVRNRLAGEVRLLRLEAARLRAAGRVAEVNARRAERERAEGDLAAAERDASDALASLVAMHAALREHARARLRARAVELSITIAAEREAELDPLEARFRDLALGVPLGTRSR